MNRQLRIGDHRKNATANSKPRMFRLRSPTPRTSFGFLGIRISRAEERASSSSAQHQVGLVVRQASDHLRRQGVGWQKFPFHFRCKNGWVGRSQCDPAVLWGMLLDNGARNENFSADFSMLHKFSSPSITLKNTTFYVAVSQNALLAYMLSHIIVNSSTISYVW